MDAGNTECLTEPNWAAFIAIDWADQKHDWAMDVPGQTKRERGQMPHSPEAIDIWECSCGNASPAGRLR